MLLRVSMFFYWFTDPRDLHSFPTRRSSDLIDGLSAIYIARDSGTGTNTTVEVKLTVTNTSLPTLLLAKMCRSEEHTSELQSRRDLVCRLLLEKKKPSSGRAGRPPRTPRGAS